VVEAMKPIPFSRAVRRLAGPLAILPLAAALAACQRHDPAAPAALVIYNDASAPAGAGSSPAALAASGASGVEAPFRSVVATDSPEAIAAGKADAAASAASAAGGSGKTGAEASPSTATGPGNGSTAVGGLSQHGGSPPRR